MAKIFVILAFLGLGALGAALWSAQQLPNGPARVVWDQDACAHCKMHLGEPAFAAQLHLKSGDIFFYDDPGCLILDMEEKTELHAVYFHHHREDRWLSGEEVAFISVANTPMGFGYGAVAADTPQAISLSLLRSKLGGRRVQP